MNLYWCDETKKHLIDMINRGHNLKECSFSLEIPFDSVSDMAGRLKKRGIIKDVSKRISLKREVFEMVEVLEESGMDKLKISKILGLKVSTVEYYLYDYHINDTRCWQDKPFAILGAM